MSPVAERVVYDCNVLLGAVLSTRGPDYQCKKFVDDGQVQLCLCAYVLQELRDA